MSILTDFFAANDDELARAFPTWLDVAEEPTIREVNNPFTGQLQRVEEWRPKSRPSAKVNERDRLPNYQDLPHLDLKGLSTVMLAQLQELISNTPYEAASRQFERPALIDPWESDETGLFQLSDEFVSSLAGIQESTISEAAAKWSNTEEMQDYCSATDCEMILRELVQLAVTTRQTGRHLYYSWSL